MQQFVSLNRDNLPLGLGPIWPLFIGQVVWRNICERTTKFYQQMLFDNEVLISNIDNKISKFHLQYIIDSRHVFGNHFTLMQSMYVSQKIASIVLMHSIRRKSKNFETVCQAVKYANGVPCFGWDVVTLANWRMLANYTENLQLDDSLPMRNFVLNIQHCLLRRTFLRTPYIRGFKAVLTSKRWSAVWTVKWKLHSTV